MKFYSLKIKIINWIFYLFYPQSATFIVFLKPPMPGDTLRIGNVFAIWDIEMNAKTIMPMNDIIGINETREFGKTETHVLQKEVSKMQE